MSVNKQKNGKWQLDIQKVGIPRIRKSFDTEKEANIFEREYILSYKKKLDSVSDKRTLRELISIWYRYHGVNLSDNERRKAQLEILASDLGNPVASQLTAAEFLDYRFDRTMGNERRLTPKSFNNLHSYLNAMYRSLKKLKVIDYECPTGEIDFIKLQERELDYLSLEQIDEIMDLAKSSRNESIWWIAQVCIRTGARWGEAENLKKKQLQNNRITYVFTKSKKTRTIPIDPTFFNDLMEFCKLKSPSERIFTNGLKTFSGIIERSGMNLPEGQKTHILRHTFASYFIMNGGNIVTLKNILGHSDIKMTMRYAHLAPDHLKDAVSLGPMATKERGSLIKKIVDEKVDD